MRFIPQSLLVLASTLFFACGSESPGPSSESSPMVTKESSQENALVMTDVAISPTNPGINPSAFAYQVQATVLAGSNSCTAAAATVSLVVRKVGHEVVVEAMRTVHDANAMCPKIFRPVYQRLSTDVRGLTTEVDAVVLRNVGELGHDQRIDLALKQG